MEFMERAIELAKKGEGYVSPNPLVGAVIVKNGRIIGEGRHKKYGTNHAEVNAFESAKEDTAGAEMYVTLEPCSHYGHTPPCAKAIIEHGIKKVYIGSDDPNPLVAGRGIKMLRDAGIEVVTGVMKKECDALNSIFFKYITTKLPYVVLKSAMTLDGKIASYTGDSKWVSNESSRLTVQHMRHALKGIMVGINTVLKDDPRLNCRIEDGVDPVKIIVDSRLRTPLEANVLKGGECIIAAAEGCDNEKKKALEALGARVIVTRRYNGRVDLKELMKRLGELKIDSILLEGGGTLNYSMLENGLIDKAVFFIAPKLIGGRDAVTPIEGKGAELMKDAVMLKNISVKFIEGDILICGDLR